MLHKRVVPIRHHEEKGHPDRQIAEPMKRGTVVGKGKAVYRPMVQITPKMMIMELMLARMRLDVGGVSWGEGDRPPFSSCSEPSSRSIA